jgi:hypothetical protein
MAKAAKVITEHEARHRLEHRQVDALALAGAVAVPQRAQHRGDGMQPHHAVGDVDRHVARYAVAAFRHQGRDAGDALHQVVIGRARGVGPVLPETKGAEIDDARIDRRHILKAQAQPRHGLRPDIVDQHVHALGQPQQHLPAFRGLQVHDDAALTAVGVQEHPAHLAAAAGANLPDDVALRAFHLDDVGAHVAKNRGGVRTHHHRGEIEHPHALQRSHGSGPRRGDIGADVACQHIWVAVAAQGLRFVAGAGSYQAPVGSCMMPGIIASLRRAAARQAPRSLKSRTTCRRRCRARRRRRGACAPPPARRLDSTGCRRRNRTGCAAASRLVGDEVQRVPRAVLLGRWVQPGGMAGAVRIAEAGDGLGKDLDRPAGRGSGAASGSSRKARRAAVSCGLRQADLARPARRCRNPAPPAHARPRVAGRGRRGGAATARRRGPSVKASSRPSARPAGEDVEVVRASPTAGGSAHGDHQRFRGAAPMSSRSRVVWRAARCPAWRAEAVQAGLVHHHRLGFAKAAAQAVQVLVVVEGVAAGPVDQADIGVVPPLAVVVERRAGVQQHVGDARDGMKSRTPLRALRHGGIGTAFTAGHMAHARPAHSCSRRPAGRSAPASPPVTAQAQTGCSPCSARCNPCAMVTRLRPCRPAPRQAGMVSAGIPQMRGGPGGVLRLAVGLAQQVALEHLPAGGAAGQETGIVQPLAASVWPAPASAPTSVPTAMGSHSASASGGRSSRERADQTKRVPRARAPRIAPRSRCRLTPPAATMRVLQRHAAEASA